MPAVGKHAVHFIHGDNFTRHLGHEIEIVRTQCAGHIKIWCGPVPSRLTVGGARHPFRMRAKCFLSASVRICTGYYVHAQIATTSGELTKGIAIPKVLAAVVQRDFGWVEGYATTSTQAGSIGMNLFEIGQPHGQIVVAGVVFSKCNLGPAHGLIEPACRLVWGRLG